jgi:hypothetical protein
VFAGIPEDPEGYDKFESNGIDVYVKKGTPVLQGVITISLVKFLWRKALTVDGISKK